MPKRARDEEYHVQAPRRSARLSATALPSEAPPPSAATSDPSSARKTAAVTSTNTVTATRNDSIPDPALSREKNEAGKKRTATARAAPDEELLQVDGRLERFRVDLLRGEVFYQHEFLSPAEAAKWYSDLLALDTYHPTLTMYGRKITQSRAIAVYATREMSIAYSGARIDVHTPLPPALAAMQARVEAALGVRFNHVMLNRYDDGSVYIGRHSDTDDNGVIVSVSVGAERTFVMTPRLPPQSAKIALTAADKKELERRASSKWLLGDGSMLIMQGDTQHFWKHEIPREPAVKAGRISLTFRQLV